MVVNGRRRFLLPLAYMLALFLLSSIPGDIEQDHLAGGVFQWIGPKWQNLLHVPLYAGLAGSWLWALAQYRQPPYAHLMIAFILPSVWGIVDEAYQLAIPGRYGSLTDIALNQLGILLVVIYAGLKQRQSTWKPT